MSIDKQQINRQQINRQQIDSRRLEVAHVSPGRIRLRWCGGGQPPRDLLEDLGHVEHMQQVEYRPDSRSLLLVHTNGFDLLALRAVAGQRHVCVAAPPSAIASMPRSKVWGSTIPGPPVEDAPVGEESGASDAPPYELQILHSAVPGRVRFRAPSLLRKPRACARLVHGLKSHPSVRNAQASPATGTLLVEFDREQESIHSIAATAAGLMERPPTAAAPGTTGAWKGLAGAPRAPEAAGQVRGAYRWLAEAAIPDVLVELESTPAGLTQEEADRRAATLGPRGIDLDGRRPIAEILKEQLVSVPTLMLAAGAVVAAVTTGVADAAVIGAVLVLNGAIGLVTERRAEAAIDALRHLGYPRANVLRSGSPLTVSAAQLVPGDVVRLIAGDLVPADARIIDGSVLIDEAMLTGESHPVLKSGEATPPPSALHAFRNVVFQGTAVVDGRARAVVMSTGRDTELGRIQAMVGETRAPRTALQIHLDELGKRLAFGAAGVCGTLFGVGLLRRYSLLQTLQNSVSLAVSAVPEALPTIATTALAIGTRRMLRREVIIRKLPAVESLGSVTTLCVDKTGTLTLNEMTVSEYWYDGISVRYEQAGKGERGRFFRADWPIDPREEPAMDAMLRVGALCSEARLLRENGVLSVSGSPTEGALLFAARAAGFSITALRSEAPVEHTIRRAEGQARMATFHRDAQGRLLAVKGSPHTVLERCTTRLDGSGNRVPLTDDERIRCLNANHRMSAAGLRVLALAEKRFDGPAPDADDEGDTVPLEELTWLGLVGLEDPIRPGVAEAIRRCRRAGVRTVILTGDQRGTALAVASKLRLDGAQGAVLEAADLEQLEGEALGRALERTAIYARVSPRDKLRIVQALQAKGEVVVMTGDGINDGPALKAADVGIAMGTRSSDVAKELADVVLSRNDFESIVAAVEQGRMIFANIRRAVRYLVSTNVADLILAGVMLVVGIPFPFHPVQILWLNLVTDVLPALALVMEPTDEDVMRQPPRKADTPVLDRRDWRALSADGAVMAGSVLAVYLWGVAQYGAGPVATAVAFTALCIGESLYALAQSGMVHRSSARRHGALWGSVAAAAGLQVAMNHWAPLRTLLHGAALGGPDYLVVLAAAVLPTLFSFARQRLVPPALPEPMPKAAPVPA